MRRWVFTLLVLSACAGSHASSSVSVPLPSTVKSPFTPQDWDIPRFFEIGKDVRMTPGARSVDTTKWLQTLLARDQAAPDSYLGAGVDDKYRLFVYSEPDAVPHSSKLFALMLPKARPYSSNGLVTAYWDQGVDAFNFGVESSRSFGTLATVEPGSVPQLSSLKGLFRPSGSNAQAFELVYDVAASHLRVFEHKGLVPGVPVSFERLTVYDKDAVSDEQEPVPIAKGSKNLSVELGLRPLAGAPWRSVEALDVEAHRVLYMTDAQGDHYFLAAPRSLEPLAATGSVATDLVLEAAPLAAQATVLDPQAAGFRITGAAQLALLSGRIQDKAQLEPYLETAEAFLAAHDDAMADLRQRGDQATRFLRNYTHVFLQTHASKRDPRAILELPYGDSFRPTNVLHTSANIWYGSDQASVLQGLIAYYRKTADDSVIEPIWGITESSVEAMTPSGSVWMKRFDEMLVAAESDASTGRSDVFIDNGGASVNFNHQRLVLRRGYERIAGVTWGAFRPVFGQLQEAVDEGNYQFAIDGDSVPKSFRTDQDSLSVSRLFTRLDGNVRVRENAEVRRGLPAARIYNEVENTGREPLQLDEARMTIGDFFNYGDGTNEIAQNRYGFSRVFEGVPLNVGFWMEGLKEPLWGDNFERGWVDLTEQYRQHDSRFLVIYGYDKAQVYYLPKRADRVLLFNSGPVAKGVGRGPAAATAAKDGYSGWTTLRVSYAASGKLGPGEVYRTPDVYSYTIWAPLFSGDADLVPDELQTLAPLWAELMEETKGTTGAADLAAHLAALTDQSKAARLRGLLNTSLESDYAYTGMQSAWMEAADLFAELARKTRSTSAARRFAERARSTRAAALKGAAFSLKAFTELRNRSDLMPAFGIMRYYGFHVPVFDWAFRETHDPRYREAMLYVADKISSSEQSGGLQVTDHSKPNYGAYVINEFSRASGANNLDDQGIKLWAMRIAYERTADPRYRRSAELCIDNWVKVRARDHHFWGMTKLFDSYVPTGLDQQRTPYGHYTLLLGLKAWADLNPRARDLCRAGLEQATKRHLVHAVGTTGALQAVFPEESNVHFDTNAELGGTFLWSLAFDPQRLRSRRN